MSPPQLAFLPSLSLPLSRPRPLATRNPPRLTRRRALFRASASDNATRASELLDQQLPATPDLVFGSLPMPIRVLISIISVSASATALYVATPRPRFKPVSAAVGAVATSVAVARLSSASSKAARKRLADLIATTSLDDDGLKQQIAALKRRFGLDDDLFAEIKRQMYELYLQAAVSVSNVSFSEIAQFKKLKAALALPGAAIGDAHFEAARAFYRANVVYLDAVDDQVARRDAQAKLDKLLFLSDRMFTHNETEEAYFYEKSRLLKFFALEESEYKRRCLNVALPFYTQLVQKACAEQGVTREDVQQAQVALGIADYNADTVRADAYANTVNRLVSEKGKLEDDDNERLTKLRVLLAIEDDRASNTLKTLAEPVYRVEVNNALDAIEKGDESFASIYGKLALRQAELAFPTDAAREAMAKEMAERAKELVRTATKYLRVQNVNGCIKQIGELLKYVDGVVKLIKVSGDSFEDDAVIIETFLPNVTAQLSKLEPKQIYRIYLSTCLEKRHVSKEENLQIARLRATMGLSREEALQAYKTAAGPVYKKAVDKAVSSGNFADDVKASVQKIRDDLALPVETSKGIELDNYRNGVYRMVDGNRIIQEHEAQALFTIRQFLDLTPEDVHPVHKSVMGPVYEQSVTEAMGPTGIMLDEYKDGLERLRERLGLSKDDADAAFNRVVKQRMVLYVNRALAQLEKRQVFRGQNEERDVGDDPNIKRAGAFLGIDAGGLTIELSNLVDFYVRNGLIKEQEVEVEGEKKTVTTYPVSLKGELQPKVYNELYKQYVVQCFSAQTRGEKQRLFAALDQLGSILGMTEDEIGKIHAEIGTVIYKNYVSQALVKGPLEDKDSEFLTNIQKMLSMKEDQCEKLLKDAKENRVSVLLEQIYGQPKVLPESVKKMRYTAQALGVDLVKDLAVPAEQRGRLFGIEIDAAIDTGMLTADNQELVAEAQEGLQVDDAVAKEVLLSCIQRRTLSHLVQATASLRQSRSESAVAELKTMLRYGKLLPAKVDAPAVSTTEKQELYLLFQADAITDGNVTEAAKEQANLLKTMFGFTDADLEVLA